MAYFREDETKAAIENFVRWNGDGASVRSAASVWSVLRSELTRRTGPTIPAIGVEAGRTERALDRMEERQARALVLYHGTDLLASTMAAELGVSRRTFYALVRDAHPAYWDALDAIASELRQRAATDDKARRHHEAARASGPHALERPSAGLARLGKRRRRAPRMENKP